MLRRPAGEAVLAAAIFLFLALVPLWRCALFGEVFVPARMLEGFEPWGTRASETWDILRWDSVAQFYPWRAYLFSRLLSGEIPLWNRHELCGTPFLANSQSAVFYPLHWVVAPLGAGWGITVAAFLHLAWAGLGCYVLCRRLRTGWWPAVLAGATFELSQWFIAWLQISSVPTTACWIPWVLAAVHRSASHPDGTGAVRLGGSVAMMLLGGHLQIAFYGLAAALAFGLVLPWTETPRALWMKRARMGALGFGLGVGLSAVQLLPVMEMGKLSHRATSPTEQGYRAYVGLAMRPQLLGLALDPYWAGNPRLGYASPARQSAGTYWGLEPLPEYASYMGIAALVAGGYALLRLRSSDPSAKLFLGLGAIAWLAALGTDLNRLAYFGIPGWAATGSPARILCLVALSGSVLAALGLQRLLEDGIELEPRLRIRMGVVLVAFVALLAALLLYLAVWSAGPSIATHLLGKLPTVLTSVVAVAVLMAALGMSARPRIRAWTAPAAFMVQLACLGPFAGSFHPTASTEKLFPRFPALETLRAASPYRVAVVNGDRWNRYFQPPALLPPNCALALGFDEVAGYDSLILRTTKERLLDPLNGGDSAVLANGNMLFVKPAALANVEALREMGVKYIAVCSQDASLNQGAPPIIEIAPAPMAEVGGAPTSLRWLDSNSFVVKGEGKEGTCFVRVAAAPGWRVSTGTSAPRSAARADPSWLAAYLPAGPSSIWRYEPSTYRVGLFFTVVALIACSGILAIEARNRTSLQPQT